VGLYAKLFAIFPALLFTKHSECTICKPAPRHQQAQGKEEGFHLFVLSIEFQQVFFIKNLQYKTISNAEIDIATAWILLFCLIELFSIIHENLPKCGINIFSTLKKMIGVGKELKDGLTDSNNENLQ